VNFEKIKDDDNYLLTFMFEIIEVKETIGECDNHKNIRSSECNKFINEFWILRSIKKYFY